MRTTPHESNELDDEGYVLVEPDADEGPRVRITPTPAPTPTPLRPTPSRPPSDTSSLASAARSSNTRPSRVKRGKPATDLRATAVPILITVGLLMLVPAVWGVLVLLDYPVPLADRPDAVGVAQAAAWAGFPLAAVLLLGGIGFAVAVLMDKGKAKRGHPPTP